MREPRARPRYAAAPTGLDDDPLSPAKRHSAAMMDLRLIRQLVRIMSGAGVTELEIDDTKEGVRVRLKRGQEAPAPGPSLVQLLPGTAPAPAAPAPAAAAPQAREQGGAAAGMHTVTSPMVGTFYRSASPEAEPFVDVGARVGEDSVVCIIEAMKVMNEIRAEVRGTVVEVLVENGEPVEYGQPLFLVKKG